MIDKDNSPSLISDNVFQIDSSVIFNWSATKIEFPGRLKDYDKISDDFYRCHKGYIVNTKHIQEIDTKNRSIMMTNGGTCIASIRLLRGLLKSGV